MNEQIEKLLQPVSAEQPCGPDLSSGPLYDELMLLIKGRPEVDIASVKRPAEPPDWRELRQKSLEYLGQSKHLRIAVAFGCSLLKTEGFTGFRDGLELIKKMLEQYWNTLHPLLDPEDNNDPTQRVNILLTLTLPRGAGGLEWLSFQEGLYMATVCSPRGAAPVTFDQLLATKQPPSEGTPAVVPDPAKLAAIMRSAAPGEIAAIRQVLQESQQLVRGIDQFLGTTLGKGNSISFDVLDQTLQEMIVVLNPYVGSANEAGAANPASGAEPVAAGESGGIKVKGAIRSSDDVVRTLDLICDYYRQVEPSSPVPYLLRRAQKLARMDFVQAVQELNLATVDSLRPSMGSAVTPETPPGS